MPGVEDASPYNPFMSQQPDPSPEEEDASLARREEEEATRYPGHEDPEQAIEPDPDAP